jgi:hypothetical protein
VHISAIVDRLFSTVDPLNVGAAKRASELSSSVGERLLLMHMKSSEDKARARQIAENLNKSFFAHGDAVSRSRARELNLKVAPSNPTLEALLWAAYLGIEGYMELRKPFSALQHYLADPQASASLRPIAPLSLPPNAPPQLAQKVWEAAAQQVLGGLGGPAVEVEYSVVNALIESTRTASEFRTKGRLSGQRAFSGEIQLTGTDTEGSWRRTDAPSLPRPNPPTGAASA